MRTLITLTICLFAAMSTAWAIDTELKPSEVFATDAPSIVLIKTYDKSGQAIMQGSGVVIAKDTVVSNCHVIENSVTTRVFYQHKQVTAKLLYEDEEHDLCSFIVKNLSAPPVQMGSTSQVKVGNTAYAIGAPEGLELTLSGGLISSLRHIPGGIVLQMTTPISPGSSGGGLFDSQGRLIGVTSYYMKKGEELNFALPVEWVNELPQRGRLAKVNTTHIVKNANTTEETKFQTGVRAFIARDYTTAYKIFEQLAKEDDAFAEDFVGMMYEYGLGVTQNYAQAVALYYKSAVQGVADAQFNLGLMYDNGEGVQQDYAQALTWYRKAAKQGDARAENNLGTLYVQGEGVPQDYAEAISWFRKSAAQGTSDAESNLGDLYASGKGVPQDYAEAVTWYRKAAAQWHTGAVSNLGVLYHNGQGVPQNYVVAYALFNLSASLDNMAATYRNKMMDSMTSAQVEAGQALTRQMGRIGVLKAMDAYVNSSSQ